MIGILVLLMMAVGVNARLGAELVTCGDFTCETDWVKNEGWVINTGSSFAILQFNPSYSGFRKLNQNINIQSDKEYNITYTIDTSNNAQIKAGLGGVNTSIVSTDGIHSFLVKTINSNDLEMWGLASFAQQMVIYDVSVKEVLPELNVFRLELKATKPNGNVFTTEIQAKKPNGIINQAVRWIMRVFR